MGIALQQVNLYKISNKEVQVVLSLSHMLELSIIFFVILCLATAYIFYDQYKTELNLKMLEQQKENLNKGLTNVREKIPTDEDREELFSKVQTLESIRNEKKAMYNQLSQLQYGSKGGFSSYFDVLAANASKELWFTKVHIFGGGKSLLLEGSAINSKIIPEMLDSLGEDEVFSSQSFEYVRIFTEEDDKIIKFIVDSRELQ